jgi:hypothetical protein
LITTRLEDVNGKCVEIADLISNHFKQQPRLNLILDDDLARGSMFVGVHRMLQVSQGPLGTNSPLVIEDPVTLTKFVVLAGALASLDVRGALRAALHENRPVINASDPDLVGRTVELERGTTVERSHRCALDAAPDEATSTPHENHPVDCLHAPFMLCRVVMSVNRTLDTVRSIVGRAGALARGSPFGARRLCHRLPLRSERRHDLLTHLPSHHDFATVIERVRDRFPRAAIHLAAVGNSGA